MMSKRKRVVFSIVLASLIFVLLLALGVDFYMASEDPIGYRNSKICPTLRPGISINELNAALGEPERIQLKGEEWLMFRTFSLAAGPIQAKVNERTNRVITLRCQQDGPATWTTQP